MDSHDLIQAGWAMARPCLHLYEARAHEPIVSILGDDDVLLRVNCRYLPQNPYHLTGVLTLTRDWDSSPSLVVDHDPDGVLEPTHAIGLAGRFAPSFPPLAALARRPRICAWLQ